METVEYHRERIASAKTSKDRMTAIRAAALHHHQARVRRLSQPAPTWVDGSPVLPSDRAVLLRQSEEHLKNPDAGCCALPDSYMPKVR